MSNFNLQKKKKLSPVHRFMVHLMPFLYSYLLDAVWCNQVSVSMVLPRILHYPLTSTPFQSDFSLKKD